MVAIGIDFGTTDAVVAVWRNGSAQAVPGHEGNLATPCVIAFTENGRLFGDAANKFAARHPECAIFDMHRLFGRKFSDPMIQSQIKFWPFLCEAADTAARTLLPKLAKRRGLSPSVAHMIWSYLGRDDTLTIVMKSKRLYMVQICAMMLQHLKGIAERFLARQVTGAVVTVPASFSTAQRQFMQDAATIAGLKIMSLTTKSSAASLTYSLGLPHGPEARNVLIFNMGGGYTNVSLVVIDQENFDAVNVCEVKAVTGASHIGGRDFTNNLMTFCIQRFKRKNGGKDLSSSKTAMQRLRMQCEQAKLILSSSTNATVEIDHLYDDIDFTCDISLAQFEDMNLEYFQESLQLVRETLRDAEIEGIQKEDIHDVVLVGGSTRIPKIQQMIKEFFHDRDPSKSVNIQEAPAFGAAIQAATKSGTLQNSLLLDVQRIAIGIGTETPDALGYHHCQVRSSSMDPGEFMAMLTSRNTIIPIRKAQTFTTCADDQDDMLIKVFEGNHTRTQENEFLGEILVSGIGPAPYRVPQVQVEVHIHADHSIVVSATDMATNACQLLDIRPGLLPVTTIQHMIDQGAQYEAEDAARRAEEAGCHDDSSTNTGSG